MIAAGAIGCTLAIAALTAWFWTLTHRTTPAGRHTAHTIGLGERPGTDDQWHTWQGPNGHPLPLNDQTRTDAAERQEGRTS